MKEIHMICNSHIDPIWQWDWQEGASAVISTFNSAVKLAEQFDYIFCHNEVTVYKYIEEYAPELFEKIKELVKQGKWRIMGGWYLQPDCNMPSGESFTRQILKGKEYFLDKFGVFPTAAINFDPFGHTRGLVQIMAKCGQNGYIICRPNGSQLPLVDNHFIWKGYDGSEIKVVRCETYNSPLGNAAETIKIRADRDEHDVVCVLWGVGNHGGGPSRKDLADIERLMKTSEDKYIHSYPEKLFERINPDYTVEKSLHISNPGCYTSMGRVKRKHIELENALYSAEKICSVAAMANLIDYPSKKIDDITEDLLNAEFHDVLPGSCVKSGEDNGLKLLNHGLLEAERLKTKAFFALSQNQAVAASGEYPVLVFNYKAYELTENIEVEFCLADQNWDDEHRSVVKVYDENGAEIKAQIIKEESNLNLDWRKRIVFQGKLQPLAVTRFNVRVEFHETETHELKKEFVFKNDRKYVEIDENTGLLKSYKLGGEEYLSGEAQLMMFDDNADPWAMQDFQQPRLGTNGKAFSLMKKPRGIFEGLSAVNVIENGDIYLGIEAIFSLENTVAKITYKIYKNNDYTDILVTLIMGDADKFVKLKLPLKNAGKIIGQTAYGTEELFSDGRENVSQRFVAVKNKDKYFEVANNCVYGNSFDGENMYISLCRGATYCAHPIADRKLIPTDRYTKKIDVGENEYSFRLTAAGEEELDRVASEFNEPSYALNAFPVGTEKKIKLPKITLSNKNLTLSAFKKSDNGNGYVIRIHNNTDKTLKTELSVDGINRKLTFGKYEAKTLLVLGDIKECKEMVI